MLDVWKRKTFMARSSFVDDFKKFLIQGDVVGLATAVIIGGAFGKIITSLVEDLITPIILNPVLTAAGAKDLASWAPNGMKLGIFLAAILNFVVVAFCIFLLIRSFEAMKTKMARQKALEEATAAPDPAVVLQEQMIASLDRVAKALENR
jgi:large conductance mechanosensitive channel